MACPCGTTFVGNGAIVNPGGGGIKGWGIKLPLGLLGNMRFNIQQGRTTLQEHYQTNPKRIILARNAINQFCGSKAIHVSNPVMSYTGYKIRGNGWIRIANQIANTLGLGKQTQVKICARGNAIVLLIDGDC